MMKGFEEAICIDPEDPDLPVSETALSADPDTKKKEEAALIRNKTAMAAYTLAFTKPAQMNMIHKAKDFTYPKGKANRVTKQLIKRYRPVDRISTVEAKTALRQVKMLRTDTPDDFINKLSAVQNKYVKAGALTDDDLLTEAIVKVPNDYKSLVAGAVARLGTALTLEDIREIMSQQYRMEHNTLRGDDDDDDDEGETALNSSDVCFNCGKPGHKSFQCRSPKKTNGNGGQSNQNRNKKKKFTGTCNNCGKVGHKVVDCWERECNKSKRPKNWKSKVEAVNAAGDLEYLLLTVDMNENSLHRLEYWSSDDDDLSSSEDESGGTEGSGATNEQVPGMREYESYSSGAESSGHETDELGDSDVAAVNVDRDETHDESEEANAEGPNENDANRARFDEVDEEELRDRFGHAAAAVQGYIAEQYNLPTYTNVDPNVFSSRETARAWMESLDTQNWQDMQALMHYANRVSDVYTHFDVTEAYETIALYTNMMRNAREAQRQRDENANRESTSSQSAEDESSNAEDTTGGGQDNAASNDSSDDDNEMDEAEVAGAVVPKTLKDIIHSEYWIGDTGATTHITHDRVGMVDLTTITQKLMMGNGTETVGLQEGTIKGYLTSKEGKNIGRITLSQVTYSKDAKLNLLSLTQMMRKGWTISSNDDAIIMSKGERQLRFDVKINTPRGVLYCIKINRDAAEAANLNVDKINNTIAHYSTVHDWLGHMGQELTLCTAKLLGITVKGNPNTVCEDCMTAKAKKKGVSKDSDHVPSSEPNGRIFLDLSKIKKPKDCPEVKKVYKSNWRMMVDEMTGLKFTEFFETKNGMVEPTCQQLSRWKDRGIPVKIIRCDNAGENLLLEKRLASKDWKLDVVFEYTARDTPQQNYLVEKGFDTMYSRGRAMMARANIPKPMKYVLFREVFKTATLLDGLVPITLKGKMATRFEHYSGGNPKFAQHLRTWGEAGVVHLKKIGTPKLTERGVTCMMVGYAIGHAGDVYRMYDPNTNRVHLTRDIKWLNRMYYSNHSNELNMDEQSESQWVDINDATSAVRKGTEAGGDQNQNQNIANAPAGTTEEASSSEGSQSDPEIIDIEDVSTGAAEAEADATTTRSGRTVRRPTMYEAKPASRYEAGGAAILSSAEWNYYTALSKLNEFDSAEVAALAGSMTCLEVIAVGAGLGGGFENTSELKVMKYAEAMAGPDKKQWTQAVKEEYERFLKYGVFEPVKKEDVPDGAKILSTTWAMKKKSNGTYRARMNMRGFEQEDGEHYDSYSISSPVTNDVSIRVCIVIMLMANFFGWLCDVKGAFLHGSFDNGEVIYTNVPMGFEPWYNPAVWMLKLLKTVYGLKQAAIMFWRELLKAMNYMKFKRSDTDPCLYWKWTQNGLLIWLSWVDDCLCIGPKEEVMKSKTELTTLFDCDDVGEFNEYVGCKLERDWSNRIIKFTQPVLLQSFEDEFDLPDREYETPAETGKVLTKCEDEQQVEPAEQKEFRSGTGKLLHLMRWSRPEIWNSVRELSRRMSKSSTDHLKAMKRVMKYCVSTKDLGWTLKPTRTWDGKDRNFEFIVSGECDSNFATCSETRKSVTGYCIYLEEALVAVKSGMQKIVAISVTEAEVIAMVQGVQEMMYIKKLIESVGLKVQLPMMMLCDNKGAVDLANGWSANGGTKHMEVKVMYLRELKEKGYIRVEWQPTSKNTSDIFTKNLDTASFRRHRDTLLRMEPHE